jgi:hypothetical protein
MNVQKTEREPVIVLPYARRVPHTGGWRWAYVVVVVVLSALLTMGSRGRILTASIGPCFASVLRADVCIGYYKFPIKRVADVRAVRSQAGCHDVLEWLTPIPPYVTDCDGSAFVVLPLWALAALALFPVSVPARRCAGVRPPKGRRGLPLARHLWWTLAWPTRLAVLLSSGAGVVWGAYVAAWRFSRHASEGAKILASPLNVLLSVPVSVATATACVVAIFLGLMALPGNLWRRRWLDVVLLGVTVWVVWPLAFEAGLLAQYTIRGAFPNWTPPRF